MFKEIENPMVLDSHWREQEREVKVFGECAGCGEDIFAGQDYYEIRDIRNNDVLMVHQDMECCMQFVGEMSWSRTAGEDE